jgi:hypothetical protein
LSYVAVINPFDPKSGGDLSSKSAMGQLSNEPVALFADSQAGRQYHLERLAAIYPHSFREWLLDGRSS